MSAFESPHGTRPNFHTALARIGLRQFQRWYSGRMGALTPRSRGHAAEVEGRHVAGPGQLPEVPDEG